MDAITWALAHWNDIFAAIGLVVTAATAIVKLTPTQADDNALAKVVKILDWVSVVAHKQPQASQPETKA